MKKIFLFIGFFACLQALALPHYELAYRLSGTGAMMMPDGKVDQFIQRPILGGSFNVEFLPTGRWHCLQQWNNASIGVGAKYLNLGNNAYLGSAIAAYAYMNQPFYNGTHFRIGARPSVGLAAVTKTYANKGAMTKYVNRQDAQDDADITKTDSTRIYIIKGEESRCSISVNIPSRMVNITYTDNRVWVKPSLGERIVNFVCNPFDSIWSLALWAVILGLGYLVYKRYQTQINAAIEEAQNNNEE